uniref:Truncated pathogenesis-related protein PR1-RK n=1 Tax=Triticum urartu TaxID=4572 RepID=A0A2Z4EIX5_TRIUA|nr:truncated pathogenesis-related protein PR1-RK [Triticum urartu]AWV55772.1 truncated pathogenesis-related protein PR1-RK isoform 1 [Triticum urartu]
MAAAAASLLLLQCVVTMLAGAATADAQYSAQTFADLQNAARADVGVAPLAWDDTLAGYAQRYAGERKGDCKLVHSDGPYGESIFWGNKGGNWTASDAVALWVQEKQYYNCSDGSCAAGKICSHYTQIVWANTTRVGCAAVACDGNLGTFILCEYDPRGNVPGVRPYAGCGQFNRSAQSSPQDFLNLQNAARAGVGVGMLSWDSTVAAYAEGYAEKRKGELPQSLLRRAVWREHLPRRHRHQLDRLGRLILLARREAEVRLRKQRVQGGAGLRGVHPACLGQLNQSWLRERNLRRRGHVHHLQLRPA